MEIQIQKPESFGVFCKNCGTYDVDVFTNDHEEIIFQCENKECETEEIF